MSVIPGLRTREQDDPKFKGSLCYIMTRTCLREERRRKKERENKVEWKEKGKDGCQGKQERREDKERKERREELTQGRQQTNRCYK